MTCAQDSQAASQWCCSSSISCKRNQTLSFFSFPKDAYEFYELGIAESIYLQCFHLLHFIKCWKGRFCSIQVANSPACWKSTINKPYTNQIHYYTWCTNKNKSFEMKNHTYRSVNFVREAMPEGIGPTKPLAWMTLLIPNLYFN